MITDPEPNQTAVYEEKLEEKGDHYPFQEPAPDDGPSDPVMPERFMIHDARSASWLVRRITEARTYAARVNLWAERETNRATHDEQFFMMRYGQQLRDWTAAEISRYRSKRRSVNLPAGMVGFRRVGPLLVIDDDEAVINWATEACPNAIVEVQRIQKAALLEHLERTGELPLGTHLHPERDRFFIK
jgi:hypothetical protein